jgi:hypothetical protein
MLRNQITRLRYHLEAAALLAIAAMLMHRALDRIERAETLAAANRALAAWR